MQARAVDLVAPVDADEHRGQRLGGHANGKLNGSEAAYWRQLGALSFIALQLPLPWFLGALTAAMAAAILKLRFEAPKPIQTPVRIILGVAVGTAFTPALIDRAPSMALRASPTGVCNQSACQRAAARQSRAGSPLAP